MAHKKGVGSTDNGRDSISKRLGVKLFGSEHARAGNIIIRQRGTKFHPGRNVGLGKDHTIYALKGGVVRFHKKRKNRTFVSIIPDEDVFAALEREKKTREETSSSDADEQSQNGRKEADAEQTKSEEKKSAGEKSAGEKSAGEKSAGEQVEAEDERQEAAPDEKKQDDLKKIGGVGPKTAEVLHASGFDTFEDISAKSPEEIHELLSEQKGSLAHLDTSTWPKQAEFLSAGDEEGLDSYLKKLEEEE